MQKIIECVPNFSEGRNPEIIKAIADSIRKCGSEGQVKILNIDPGEATNRTVITFAGNPEAVVEAAFRSVSKAAELIDMRQHHGAHPRSGATDVHSVHVLTRSVLIAATEAAVIAGVDSAQKASAQAC